jgi:hypothetical protein
MRAQREEEALIRDGEPIKALRCWSWRRRHSKPANVPTGSHGRETITCLSSSFIPLLGRSSTSMSNSSKAPAAECQTSLQCYISVEFLKRAHKILHPLNHLPCQGSSASPKETPCAKHVNILPSRIAAFSNLNLLNPMSKFRSMPQ